MHPFEMPREYVERVVARGGREHNCESFDGERTALVVVDMQNYFLDPRYPAACPVARDIVPNVNRLAAAVRKVGGVVVWLQHFAPDSFEKSWSAIRERFTADRAKTYRESLHASAEGYQLWPGMDVRAGDEAIAKRRYSAFIPGSSNIADVLADRGIDTLIVTGVATNVCCESTARDAMMLNYRVLMVSDACAAASDAEHAAALGSFYLYFGDVRSTDETVASLEAGQQNPRESAARQPSPAAGSPIVK